MSATLTVFVNERALRLPPGADVLAAVRAFDPALEAALDEGAAYVTDGRGIPVAPTASLSGGAILRVVVSSRRTPAERDADA
jgi:hypothetical protein